MTREEAIEILRQFKRCLADAVFDEKGSEAWQMAIQALEQEPTGNNWDCDCVKMTYEVDSFPKGIMFRFSDGTIKRVQTVEQTVQEPCDDAISREAVIHLVRVHIG